MRLSCAGTTTDITPLESQRTSMLPIDPIASTTPLAPSLRRVTRSPTANPEVHMRGILDPRAEAGAGTVATVARPFLTAAWHNVLGVTYPADESLLAPHLPRGAEIDRLEGS